MTTSVAIPPKLQFFSAAGVPLSGGKLYSYAAGTTTPLATYTDSTGNTANANPVILDSRGEANVWFAASQYKLKLTDSTDTLIWTVDSLNGANPVFSDSDGSSYIGYIQGGTGSVATTVQAKLREAISVKDFGAVGNGSTNDRNAINLAQTAAAGSTLFFPPGTYSVQSNLTITANCQFQAGAKLAPASGVTVTITGAIVAGDYQIFVVTSSAHVSMVSSPTQQGAIEWYGVTGGDVAFSSANAELNKPLIDEAITYGPSIITWLKPGIYSTTGHQIGGDRARQWVSTLGTTIIGSGIAFADAANMPATEPSKYLRYVIQPGPQYPGLATQFIDIDMTVSDQLNVCSLGLLASTTVQNHYQIETVRGVYRGYFAMHQTLSYTNKFDNTTFIGNGLTVNGNFSSGSGGAAIAQTCGAYIQPDTEIPAVVRQLYTHCQLYMSGTASGQLLYQNQDVSYGGAAINANHWDTCTFLLSYDGFVLDAQTQLFTAPEIEQQSNITVVSESTASSARSMWVQPYISQDPSCNALVAALRWESLVLFRSSIRRGEIGLETSAVVQGLALTGATAAINVVYGYTLGFGKYPPVTLSFNGLSGTSNSTAKSFAAIPANLWPASEKRFVYLAYDNGGSYVAAAGELGTNGIITLYPNAAFGNWTASGTFSLASFSLTYIVGQ